MLSTLGELETTPAFTEKMASKAHIQMKKEDGAANGQP